MIFLLCYNQIRIGGDEFVLITEFTELEDAQAVARKILSLNGGTVKHADGGVLFAMTASVAVCFCGCGFFFTVRVCNK